VQVDGVGVGGRACRRRDEEGLIGDILGRGVTWAQVLRTGARAVYLNRRAAVVVQTLIDKGNHEVAVGAIHIYRVFRAEVDAFGSEGVFNAGGAAAVEDDVVYGHRGLTAKEVVIVPAPGEPEVGLVLRDSREFDHYPAHFRIAIQLIGSGLFRG
jgi:hypothetical protein